MNHFVLTNNLPAAQILLGDVNSVRAGAVSTMDRQHAGSSSERRWEYNGITAKTGTTKEGYIWR